MAVKVVLKNVRLAPFPQLYTARQYKGVGDFSYEAGFLFAPGSEADREIKRVYQDVAVEAWKDKASSMLQQFKGNNLKTFLIDGNSKPDIEGFPGNLFVKAKRKQKDGRPDIRDMDGKRPLAEADGRPYAGCYVNAVLEVWAQTKDTPGMRCKLLGLQFVRDGDALAGSATSASEDDFEDLSDGADAPDVATGTGGFV
jgi:hypothetical protein